MMKFFFSMLLLVASKVEAFGVVKIESTARNHGMMHNVNDEETVSPRRAFLAAAVASLTVAVPSFASYADDGAAATLHVVDYPVPGKCGQAQVPEKGVFFAKSLGGMVDGACVTEGFTVSEGTAQGTTDKDKQRTFEIYGK